MNVFTAESPRLWLIDGEGNELVQVQRDMFFRNWRRYQDATVEYPRFSHILPAFQNDFREFKDFVEAEGLGPLTIDQTEVTYINHIFPADPGAKGVRLSDFTKYWLPTDQEFGSIERFDVNFSKLLEEDGKPFGRLHVKMTRGRVSDRDMMVMNLTARGQKERIKDFLEIGHREIVTGFDVLTTKRMHVAWGKES